MKKLGQKLSFLTKILLVVGLLISNLSSLSVVFAYEAPADVVVSLNEETLEIKYNEELAEEVEAVNVIVYEKYAYLDGTFETFGGTSEEVKNVYSLNAEELLEAKEGTLELEYNSIFANEEDTVNNFELFDGIYSVKVEIVDVTDYSEATVVATEQVVSETTQSESTETGITGDALGSQAENNEIQMLETENFSGDQTSLVLSYGVYEEEMTHNGGLDIKVFNSEGVEVVKVNGKYSLSREETKLTVVAQILPGGLNPTDKFEYDGEGYFAYELINEKIPVLEKDFIGHLYGDYELPVEIKLLKQLPGVSEVQTLQTETVNEVPEGYEEVVYTDSVNVLYGTYSLNTEILNAVTMTEGYQNVYLFSGDSKDGLLYVLAEFEETTDAEEETVVTKTMLDLYNIFDRVFSVPEGVEQPITFTLLKDGVNVLESYAPAIEEDTIESYLATVGLDDSVKIVLSSDGLTLTYRVVVVADFNNDNMLTEDDLLELIDQFVGESEVADIKKSDLTENGKLDSLDVLGLNQVIKNKEWHVQFDEVETTLDSSLDVKLNGELLSEENYLTSGDKFTVDYVLSLTDYDVNSVAGLFNYDDELFELISVDVAEATEEWIGNYHEGKFLYLGEESLTAPEDEADNQTPETGNTELMMTTDEESETSSLNYVVVTATFIALKSTNEDSDNVITLEEIELFNSTEESLTVYQLDINSVSTEAILVTASEDNTLSYLEVAGVEITLEDGVYEYEINVESDVTAVDLKYILSNIAASITSTVCPEELVEGSNIIILTVTSESGVSQDYTITVIREKVEKPTTQVNYNNYYGDYEEEEEEVIVTPGVEEEPDEDLEPEKESNISRIIIIILILLVIAGLVYLIFKDENDDETKKANKQINKLKKEGLESEVKHEEKTSSNKNSNNKNKVNNNKNSGNKDKGSKKNKKAR